MIYRMLGSTGEKVSAMGVGGWHLGLKHVALAELAEQANDRETATRELATARSHLPQAPEVIGLLGRRAR